MSRRSKRLAALALASCEGTTFRCDPSPSFSYDGPRLDSGELALRARPAPITFE